MQTETRYLKCDLTDEEYRDRGKRLAEAKKAIRMEQDGLKEYQAQAKGRIAMNEAIERELGPIVETGQEWRNVECETILDRESCTATVIRLDTGEIVQRRAMTEEELQIPLFGGAK